MKPESAQGKALEALRQVLDRRPSLYRELADASDLGEYLANGARQDDEELLTEGILAEIIERVLGFPPDAYFPQLSKSGLKPDFTPMDLIAHPFVLDAKSSRQKLSSHEGQIRAYVDQRHLDFGVLFNLAEVRVYRRATEGHDELLSFSVLALWRPRATKRSPGRTSRPSSAFSRISPTNRLVRPRKSTRSAKRLLGRSAGKATSSVSTSTSGRAAPSPLAPARRGRRESAGSIGLAYADGQVLVTTAERLVCALFGVPPELEDEVVAHGLARAKAAAANSA